MLSVGDKAPSFTLKNQNDEDISLSDFQGSKLLVWFSQKLAQEVALKKDVEFVIILKNFRKIILM